MRGRSRQIKPELFADEQLGDLEQETNLPVFRAFVGLLVFADREGRFRWAPRALKGAISPCSASDFSAVLEALESRSFIIRYTVNGEDFGFIRSFHKHQTIHPKETQSVLPDPSTHGTTVHSACFPVIPGNSGNDTEGAAGVSGTLLGTLEHAHAQACEVEVEVDRTRETDPPSVPGLTRVGSPGVSRTYSMPCEAPPQEFLDEALMGAVSREQATSTWKHYFGAGLPDRGVERLYAWLIQRARERATQQTRLPSGARRHGSAQPDCNIDGFNWAPKQEKS